MNNPFQPLERGVSPCPISAMRPMLRTIRIHLLFAYTTAVPLYAQTDTLSERMLAGEMRDLLGDTDTTQHKGLTAEIVDMVSQQVQEAPGIVYVLTAEEIAASGSR